MSPACSSPVLSSKLPRMQNMATSSGREPPISGSSVPLPPVRRAVGRIAPLANMTEVLGQMETPEEEPDSPPLSTPGGKLKVDCGFFSDDEETPQQGDGFSSPSSEHHLRFADKSHRPDGEDVSSLRQTLLSFIGTTPDDDLWSIYQLLELPISQYHDHLGTLHKSSSASDCARYLNKTKASQIKERDKVELLPGQPHSLSRNPSMSGQRERGSVSTAPEGQPSSSAGKTLIFGQQSSRMPWEGEDGATLRSGSTRRRTSGSGRDRWAGPASGLSTCEDSRQNSPMLHGPGSTRHELVSWQEGSAVMADVREKLKASIKGGMKLQQGHDFWEEGVAEFTTDVGRLKDEENMRCAHEDALRPERESHQSVLHTLQQQRDELVDKVETLEGRCAELQASLDYEKAPCHSTDKKLHDLHAENNFNRNELEKQISLLRGEKDRVEKQLRDLEAENKSYENELKKADKEIFRLHNKKGKYQESQHGALSSNLTPYTSAIQHLHEALHTAYEILTANRNAVDAYIDLLNYSHAGEPEPVRALRMSIIHLMDRYAAIIRTLLTKQTNSTTAINNQNIIPAHHSEPPSLADRNRTTALEAHNAHLQTSIKKLYTAFTTQRRETFALKAQLTTLHDKRALLYAELAGVHDAAAHWETEYKAQAGIFAKREAHLELLVERQKEEMLMYVRDYHARMPSTDPEWWKIEGLRRKVRDAEAQMTDVRALLDRVRDERDAAYARIEEDAVEKKQLARENELVRQEVVSDSLPQGNQVGRKKKLPLVRMHMSEQAVAEQKQYLDAFRKKQEETREAEWAARDVVEKMKWWKMGEKYPPLRKDWGAIVDRSAWDRWGGDAWLKKGATPEEMKEAVTLRKAKAL